MKRWFVVALAAAAMALVPTAAAADEEHGDGHGKHFGPFKSSSTDSGTCGNDWANDTFKREFFVHQTALGTWRVTEAYIDGHYETSGSEPRCVTALSLNGDSRGWQKEVGGFLFGTVTGGRRSAQGLQGRDGGLQHDRRFHRGRVRDCRGINVTSFFFSYKAHDTGLINRLWVNASDDQGGNRGDIATS